MFAKKGPGAKSADAVGSGLPDNAVMIAGEHFGLGEQAAAAATLLRERGVVAVVAKDFGRHFYREAINSGVALFTADLTGQVADGEDVALDLRKGTVSSGETQVQAERYPERLARVVEYGSLVTAIKKELGKE
jgi:3-isopropylmalate dehydratase small subunit